MKCFRGMIYLTNCDKFAVLCVDVCPAVPCTAVAYMVLCHCHGCCVGFVVAFGSIGADAIFSRVGAMVLVQL